MYILLSQRGLSAQNFSIGGPYRSSKEDVASEQYQYHQDHSGGAGFVRMGCGSSKSAVLPLDHDIPGSSNISITAQTPQGLAFEIPLRDNEDEDSIIKKHPPKRLQRLEEQQTSPPTLEELEEKLAEAEQRRQQILSQRVASARAAQKLKRNGESKTKDLLIERLHQEPTTVEL